MHRAEVFTQNLKRLDHLPAAIDTLLLMDSNGHQIKGKDIDPEGSTWVVSSGGLCLVAAVHTLRALTTSYDRIHKVIFHIGFNDELHKRQHIGGERPKYLAELSTVTKNVFPNAAIKFIIPFIGGRMSSEASNSLKEDIVKYMPDCTVYTPPPMQSKLRADGIHLNHTGITTLKKFIADTIIMKTPRIFSGLSGRKSYNKTYSEAMDRPSLYSDHRYQSPYMSRRLNYGAGQEDMYRPYHSDQSYPSLPTPHMNMRRSVSTPHRQPVDQELVAQITEHVVEALLKCNVINNARY